MMTASKSFSDRRAGRERRGQGREGRRDACALAGSIFQFSPDGNPDVEDPTKGRPPPRSWTGHWVVHTQGTLLQRL